MVHEVDDRRSAEPACEFCTLLQEAAQQDRLQSEAARFEAEAAAGAA